MSGFDPRRAESFREMRVPIQRVDELGRVTAHGTARQQGVTLEDYRTDAGIPIKEGPGDSIVVSVLNVSVDDRQRYLEIVEDLDKLLTVVREPSAFADTLTRARVAISELVSGAG